MAAINPVTRDGSGRPVDPDGDVITIAGNPRKIDLSRQVTAAGSGARVDGAAQPQVKFFDYNFYAMKKGISSALLDVALLMANASQLKSVFVAGSDYQFYVPMLILLISSILLQVVIGVVLILLGRLNINNADERVQNKAEMLNNFVIIGVFLLTLLNVFIAAIGIGTPDPRQDV